MKDKDLKTRIEYYKKNPKELKDYVTTALDEYQKNYNEKTFFSALSFATQVHGGRLSNTTLRLSTIRQVMNTLGFSLAIK